MVPYLYHIFSKIEPQFSQKMKTKVEKYRCMKQRQVFSITCGIIFDYYLKS